MPTLTITLPSLHDGQEQVKASDARFKVLACGRRWGKTRLGAALCVATALQGKRAWWIAPSYKMAAVGWRGIRQLAQQIPGIEIRKVDRMTRVSNGGWAQVRSADDPQSLRGEGLDFVVLDECAFIKEAAWSEAIRPSLSDRGGGAMFISTPKGRNWFWRLWKRGNSGDDAEWQSWRFPTGANPFINASEIEAARANLPERIFRQEYLAEFIEDAGAVFRRVIECANAERQEKAQEDHQYLFGVDWGKANDFTVITVLDITENQAVYLDRFNQIDYAVQSDRLAALAERFRPTTIIAEQNSMGEPIIEQLRRRGLPVQGFMTTNATKTQIIESLALALERGEIGILPDQTLIGELQAYSMDRLPSGKMRYSAPDGMHDDCVMSLALAWHGANTSSFDYFFA